MFKDTKVNILGAEYTVTCKKYDEDPVFKERNACGFCNPMERIITICDLYSYPDLAVSDEYVIALAKETIRHEVIHAFLFESGLAEDSLPSMAWAMNEEMVDWLATQTPKMFKVFDELGIM